MYKWRIRKYEFNLVSFKDDIETRCLHCLNSQGMTVTLNFDIVDNDFSIQYSCDRCGNKRQICTKNDIIVSFAKIDLWRVGQHRTDAPQRIDLCENCYEKFVDFLEM